MERYFGKLLGFLMNWMHRDELKRLLIEKGHPKYWDHKDWVHVSAIPCLALFSLVCLAGSIACLLIALVI